jgi:hypothetical protein
MAMMLFLMVGIGLYYLPDLRRHDPAADDAVVDPTPADEVGPSAVLAPAEPLDLDVDPRTGRLRTHTDDEVVAAHDPPSPNEEGVEARSPVVAVNRPRPAQPVVGNVVQDPLEPIGNDQVAEEDPGEAIVAPMPTVAPTVAPEAPVPTPQPPTPPVAASLSGQEAFDRGMERYRTGDYRGAADDFSDVVGRRQPDTARLLPTALHQLARSNARANSCVSAVNSYESLIERYPTYSSRPQAMIEAADCYRRLGRIDRERRMLERAMREPVVAAQAEQELTRLRVTEQQRLDSVERMENRATTSQPMPGSAPSSP